MGMWGVGRRCGGGGSRGKVWGGGGGSCEGGVGWECRVTSMPFGPELAHSSS